MAFDSEKLLALELPAVTQSYGPRECILYGLGLGLGLDPLDESQLRHVDETKLVAVPTMANVLAYPGFWMRDLDTGIDWVHVVHGEQSLTLHRPLPTAGTVKSRSAIVDLVDKGEGRGAIIHVEREICDARTGEPFATILQTVFCRRDGGFGGKSQSERRPHPVPDRQADLSVDGPTHPQLALIYRLSGDDNPLHSDPAMAASGGFERPILHGLATFGIAGTALLQACCEGETERFLRLDARFSSAVYPGETITIDVWHEGEGRAAFRARVAARGAVVLTNGRFDYRTGPSIR